MARRLSKSFGCPAEFTLQVLGGKWKTVIMCYLKERPMRYGELRKMLPHMSDKVLTERLRELEDTGLVARTVKGADGKGVTYRLSTRGESLRSVLTSVYRWGVEHRDAYGVRFSLPLLTLGKSPRERQPA